MNILEHNREKHKVTKLAVIFSLLYNLAINPDTLFSANVNKTEDPHSSRESPSIISGFDL